MDNQILTDYAIEYCKIMSFMTICDGRFQNFDSVFIQGEDDRIISLHMRSVNKDTINQYNTEL